MMAWQHVLLSELAEVTAGNPAPQEASDFAAVGDPFVRMQDVGREHHTKNLLATTDRLAPGVVSKYKLRRFPAGTLLIPKSGASVNLNHRALLGQPAYVVSHLATVVPDTRLVVPEYLYYWSLIYDPRHQAQTTSLPSLPTSLIKSAKVPLPALDEQRRIVDLLSRAEGIVRLRREAQKKAAAIIPALFLDMFGDPATNPKGWRLNTLGAHVFIPSTVRTPDLVLDADRLCIGADSIESNTGTFLSCLTVREVVPKSGKYWFEERDVLYSKIRPYLAKVALAKTHGYCSADMYPLRSKSTVEPQFLLSLLLSKAFTDFATAESVRAQMPKLNRETLFSFTFPLPPAAIQKKFSVLSEQVQSVLGQQVTASAKAEAIFTALLSRVFSADGLRSLEHAADKADGLELDIPLLGDVLCA